FPPRLAPLPCRCVSGYLRSGDLAVARIDVRGMKFLRRFEPGGSDNRHLLAIKEGSAGKCVSSGCILGIRQAISEDAFLPVSERPELQLAGPSLEHALVADLRHCPPGGRQFPHCPRTRVAGRLHHEMHVDDRSWQVSRWQHALYEPVLRWFAHIN